MINKIWFFMIALSIAFATTGGRLEALSIDIFNSLTTSVELAIGLIGSMVLWCGVLKVAKCSGLVDRIAYFIRPLLLLIFSDIRENSAAMGAIVMNITSNMFGLGNAATPLGLKAMEELQKQNPIKEKATNAMCLFLVINAAPISFIPSTVLSLRVACGSKNPGIIIIPSILTSLFAIIVGIICCKIAERRA